jgi:hypothetical protein
MNSLPDFLKRPMILAAYRADLVGKRNLLRFLFSSVSQSRQAYVPLRDTVRSWTNDDFLELPHGESRRALYAEKEASKAAYEDSAAALMLISAASLERLSGALGHLILDRGVASYVSHIYFARAVWELSNQYKHLGDWRHNPKKRARRTMRTVILLVDDPLRMDAAAEFLERAAFSSYDEFESALLSCVEGLSGAGVVPGGADGIASVTIR